MNINTYIVYVICALLPSIIYLTTLFFVTKPKDIDFRFILGALFIGAFSVELIKLSQISFPGIHNMICENLIISLAFYSFIQIALLEELSKAIFFKTILQKRSFSPLTIWFLSLIPAVAFSGLENVLYLKRVLIRMEYMKSHMLFFNIEILKSSVWKLLGGRAIFSVPLHIFCASLVGYFVSIAKHQKSNLKNKLSKFFNKSQRMRTFTYASFGILLATAYHGLYDYIIFLTREGYLTPQNLRFNMIAMLIFSILCMKYMISHLKKIENQSLDSSIE